MSKHIKKTWVRNGFESVLVFTVATFLAVGILWTVVAVIWLIVGKVWF